MATAKIGKDSATGLSGEQVLEFQKTKYIFIVIIVIILLSVLILAIIFPQIIPLFEGVGFFTGIGSGIYKIINKFYP
jgi:hypothetical protein